MMAKLFPDARQSQILSRSVSLSILQYRYINMLFRKKVLDTKTVIYSISNPLWLFSSRSAWASWMTPKAEVNPNLFRVESNSWPVVEHMDFFTKCHLWKMCCIIIHIVIYFQFPSMKIPSVIHFEKSPLYYILDLINLEGQTWYKGLAAHEYPAAYTSHSVLFHVCNHSLTLLLEDELLKIIHISHIFWKKFSWCSKWVCISRLAYRTHSI